MRVSLLVGGQLSVSSCIARACALIVMARVLLALAEQVRLIDLVLHRVQLLGVD